MTKRKRTRKMQSQKEHRTDTIQNMRAVQSLSCRLPERTFSDFFDRFSALDQGLPNLAGTYGTGTFEQITSAKKVYTTCVGGMDVMLSCFVVLEFMKLDNNERTVRLLAFSISLEESFHFVQWLCLPPTNPKESMGPFCVLYLCFLFVCCSRMFTCLVI